MVYVLYLLSPGVVRLEEPHQTKWAELNGLSPAVNTACLPTLLCICSVCSQAAGLRTEIQHLKLPSSPTRTSWGSTHISVYADCCLLVCLPYIPWFQLTAADVSQLALRPNLNKGRLSQVGHMSSWRLQSPFPPTRIFRILSECVKFWVSFSFMTHLLWYTVYKDNQTHQSLWISEEIWRINKKISPCWDPWYLKIIPFTYAYLFIF